MLAQILTDMEGQGLEDKDFVSMTKKSLRESQQYLETDFKIHVKPKSRVADHCLQFALSDKDNQKFATSCTSDHDDSHNHNLICGRCELLKSTLGEVRKHSAEWKIQPKQEKERIQRKIFEAETKILDLRRHQVRTVEKTIEQIEIIEFLAADEVYIVLDFAMKWQPKKGRERQTDFFGKRG